MDNFSFPRMIISSHGQCSWEWTIVHSHEYLIVCGNEYLSAETNNFPWERMFAWATVDENN